MVHLPVNLSKQTNLEHVGYQMAELHLYNWDRKESYLMGSAWNIARLLMHKQLNKQTKTFIPLKPIVSQEYVVKSVVLFLGNYPCITSAENTHG